MSRKESKTTALVRAVREWTDAELIAGMRRSSQLLERKNSFHVAYGATTRKDGIERTELEFDERALIPAGTSWLVIDDETPESLAPLRRARKGEPLSFDLPPGRTIVRRRRYVLFRMWRA